MSDGAAVELLWVPLGAGSRLPVVRWSGSLYEAWTAWRAARAPRALFHAALEVSVDGGRWSIEMVPAWQSTDFEVPAEAAVRGGAVVASGPVGMAVLGRSRYFRYEVRARPDGVIPDRQFAVETVRVRAGGAGNTAMADVARRVLELVSGVPRLTWGRDEARAGEMWNSNSVVAWLLASSGADVDSIVPPEGGRAPGWQAGLAVAAR